MQDPAKRNSKDIVRIVAVSPGDVKEERNILARVIDELNNTTADSLGLSIELSRWETDAHPGFHVDGPQGLIDPILSIEDSDLVVGIFWKRFGTPTTDSKSGTEHELKNAWSSWERTKHPQVMVYFNEEPYNPKSKAEVDQWGQVLDFKEHFPKEGLWWSYTGKIEFEKLIRGHITMWLLREFGNAKESDEPQLNPIFFEAPQFTDQIDRPLLLASLQSKIESNSVVAVEGLAGSGKTYFATSCVSALKNSGKIRDEIWYDAQEGESLDDFLAQIGTQVRLNGLSPNSKCKQLLHYLYKTNTLLVIDDFHQVNTSSFSILVNLAIRYQAPANLLLVSRLYVDLLRNLSQIGRIEVRGFDPDEMRVFLNRCQVRSLSQSIIEDLIEKTDGLPLAASLFAALVRDFNRHPKSLLSNTLLNTERLKLWFKELLTQLGTNEMKLLKALSVCDGPFNIWIVGALGRHEEIADTNKTFENLQRAYLVQRYSRYRWNIHHLIAMFCGLGFDPSVKQAIHLALARYYLRRYRVSRRPQVFTEKEFIYKVRACKQFQLANDYKSSERLIHDIYKTAKTRGYYQTLIELCKTEIDTNGSRSNWIDYHYAHCCLITGRLKSALKIIEPLLYVFDDKSSNKRVAFTRLYAEILASTGKPKLAFDKLREAITTVEIDTVSFNVLSQARSVEVWLLTQLGDFSAARELCYYLLERFNQGDGDVGKAVAITRAGVLDQLSGYPEDALKRLNRAIELFRKLEDQRGLAWALSYLTLCKLDLDDEWGALTCLRECLRIELDINGCSVDYFLVLKELKKKTKDRTILRLAEIEIKRVSSVLDNLVQ